jgi:hypothetical protein
LELFNVVGQISETTNLAKENPNKVEVLAKVLGDHLREARGQMPIVKETGNPVPLPDEVLQAGRRKRNQRHGGWHKRPRAILGAIILTHEFRLGAPGRCAPCRLANSVRDLGGQHNARRRNGLRAVGDMSCVA